MPDFAAATTAPQPRTVLRRLIARQAVPLLLLGLVVWLLRDRASGLDLGGILGAARAIPPLAWACALLATLISFWAVGRYDAVIHRTLGTGVSGPAARRSGIAAIATAQTAGFGLLTGTLARWRMLPDLSLWQSARLTVTVTVSFMAGLAVVGAAMTLIAPTPVPRAVAGVVLLAALVFVAVSLWRPRHWLRLRLPPVRAQGAIVGLVALDTAAAALALYVLLPAGQMPPVALFYAVFLLALGAGMIGATPGGVGPFEVVCLACLPMVPEAGLLAAVAGYRLVYYGLPGALALVLLLAGGRASGAAEFARAPRLLGPAQVAGSVPDLDALLYRAPRAEAQLLRQGELSLLGDDAGTAALAAASGQSLIVLGDALNCTCPPERLLRMAKVAARARGLSPVLYKCAARSAVAARRAGWRVATVSHEAWIAPGTHDVARPECRQLRRLLRKARAADLYVAEAGAFLPLKEMTRIADAWARRRGSGARGFSLGRFDPGLLHGQRVFLAYDGQRRLVAFATFHVARTEWTLDQMCQTAHTPPGAMHLLIDTAIAAAHRLGVPRLSLAAVPRPAPRWLPLTLAHRLDAYSGATGLRRFKSAFAPRWEPLYVAAPTRPALALGGLDLLDRITRPGPRAPAPGPDS